MPPAPERSWRVLIGPEWHPVPEAPVEGSWVRGHARVFSAGFPAAFLARRAGVPLVISEHYTGFPRGTLSRWDRFVARAAFRRAALVCPDSADLGRHPARLEPRAR